MSFPGPTIGGVVAHCWRCPLRRPRGRDWRWPIQPRGGDAAARTVDALTQLLHFDVPVSRSALSMAFLAVIDGLVLDAGGQMAAQHRQAYDAFWLAVLSLTV